MSVWCSSNTDPLCRGDAKISAVIGCAWRSRILSGVCRLQPAPHRHFPIRAAEELSQIFQSSIFVNFSLFIIVFCILKFSTQRVYYYIKWIIANCGRYVLFLANYLDAFLPVHPPNFSDHVPTVLISFLQFLILFMSQRCFCSALIALSSLLPHESRFSQTFLPNPWVPPTQGYVSLFQSGPSYLSNQPCFLSVLSSA